jgi:predicted N-acetyltransferase YhbS
VPKGKLDLPGPVDPARLLAVELTPGALAGASGRVIAMRV